MHSSEPPILMPLRLCFLLSFFLSFDFQLGTKSSLIIFFTRTDRRQICVFLSHFSNFVHYVKMQSLTAGQGCYCCWT